MEGGDTVIGWWDHGDFGPELVSDTALARERAGS